MDQSKLTYRDYAHFAHMSAEQIERDCTLQVFRASGPGGQGVNTTDSAVRLIHVPTGEVATARESRSQFQNRAICIRKLRDTFARKAVPPRKRIKTKPSRAAQQRRLNSKHMNALKKQRRRKVDED